MEFLLHGTAPHDKMEAHKFRAWAFQYVIIDGQLYWQSAQGSYLWCLSKVDSYYLIVEIHHRQRGNHNKKRTLAHYDINLGYYWSYSKQMLFITCTLVTDCSTTTSASTQVQHYCLSLTLHALRSELIGTSPNIHCSKMFLSSCHRLFH